MTKVSVSNFQFNAKWTTVDQPAYLPPRQKVDKWLNKLINNKKLNF